MKNTCPFYIVLGVGYSKKIPNRGLQDILFLKKILEFLNLSLYSWKLQRKQKLIEGQKPKPMEIPRYFILTSGTSISLLIDPWNLHMLFLQCPWKFYVLSPPPCLYFFWNSPFQLLLGGTFYKHL